jgi:dTMP kinase
MGRVVNITLPATRQQLADLAVGDEVRLFGTIYTMRDAGHLRALEHLNLHGELPYNLDGQALFYAGPTEPAAGRPFGAIGPTTASRMDFATPELLEAGITLTLGKGSRSHRVVEACAKTGGVYLIAVGGAAAYLASYVENSELIAWQDLGTEALRRLTLNGLPAFVGIDARGNALWQEVQDLVRDDNGVFITFEGGEGVGKSTQIKLLQARLEANGYDVLCLREPGGTAIGEQIRAILLNPNNNSMEATSELLLYEAARAQLVNQVIKPALTAGQIVLCDRYFDSTFAYQARARGLDAGMVNQANRIGSDGLAPTRTILLEQDVSRGLQKATEDGADRLEAEGLEFHQKVHEGFDLLAATYPERIYKVKCQEKKQDTAVAVFDQLKDLFPKAANSSFTITDTLLQAIKDTK